MDMIQLMTSFFKKLMDLKDVLFDFLFTEFDVFGMTLSVWQVVGGVGIVSILIMVFIKAFNPLS